MAPESGRKGFKGSVEKVIEHSRRGGPGGPKSTVGKGEKEGEMYEHPMRKETVAL